MQDSGGFFSSQNYPYIRSQLEKYRFDPKSVDESWRKLFDGIGDDGISDMDDEVLSSIFAKSTVYTGQTIAAKPSDDGALAMLHAYRSFGSLEAQLDPLKMSDRSGYDILSPVHYCKDLAATVDMKGALGLGIVTASEALDKMRKIYCGTRSMEAMHISDLKQLQWLLEKFEGLPDNLDKDTRHNIYRDMLESEIFEQFLHVKFSGAKRFSIEGGEASMVVFEALIEGLSAHGFEEFVMGMPHRGRLNCLVKIVGKPYSYIISEFMDSPVLPSSVGLSGDVKYHLGASVDRTLRNGKKVTVSLTPNPSHLEAVNAVAMGRAKAKQVLRGGGTDKVVAILSHGDSSFAGQGVVYESIQLSGVDGYAVGGVIHVVVNNQVGFTADPQHYSSTRHPTEMAKFIGAPIFHVNGDDPESAYLIAKLAAEYRSLFQGDVVINVVCYRKYGHNEGDEPMFTQPLMYKKIASRPSSVHLYKDKLVSLGIMTEEFADSMAAEFKNFLSSALSGEKNEDSQLDWLQKNWKNIQYSAEPFDESVVNTITSINKSSLDGISSGIFSIPNDFKVNPKIVKLFESRKSAMSDIGHLDWGTAEWLAFGSLMVDGYSVRVSGQDSMRGTFSHRHAVIFDFDDGHPYNIFKNLEKDGVRFDVISSPLSEYGVLGFEYGYSNVTPDTLIIWEAQYGDFANVAQVVFDQFISSSELKWLRMSGITVLLPHGYEGQGPEHSSARLERYLQLCAENNMRVINCTTPANYFHALRRQMLPKIRKPLVVCSPKSLLRHKLAVSSINDFLSGSFQCVIGDVYAQNVKKIIICSGKVYYDLDELRVSKGLNNVAILRIEQLYPLDQKNLVTELSKYSGVSKLIWCQEEPKNMGAWSYILPYLLEISASLGMTLQYVGRKEAAATAVGYHSIHTQQQSALLEEALHCE